MPSLQAPQTSPALDFSSLPAFLAAVGGWMDRVLPGYIPEGEPRDFLYDLAREYPARGGKRFRPALLLLCTTFAGGDAARALPSAVALELFQNFALVHDDIEDDSLVRRGRPTLHRQHGVPLALNAGDLLLGLVYEALLDNEALLGAPLALEVQRRFALAFRHTFEGQAMDIGWSRGSYFPVRADYEVMIGKKTGWYSGRAPCEIGALIGGSSEETRAMLGEFGARLGVGFQVRDDLLNLTSDSAESAPGAFAGGYGKERGGDIAEGKRTLIVIELLERLPAAEQEQVKAILLKAPAETSEEEIERVIGLAERTGAMAVVQDHCRSLGTQAQGLLDPLPASPQKELLRAMAQYLVEERES
jgi:geranylgeranyl diphosphate synthase type II